jgi:hypothetical protein
MKAEWLVTRDELIEEIALYLAGELEGEPEWSCMVLAKKVLGIAEPLIRADERSYSRTAAGVRRDAEEKWADLHAQVEALPVPGNPSSSYRLGYGDAIANVLALFKGAAND